MSEQPEAGLLDGDVLLFRRIPPDAVVRGSGRPRHTAFRLRVAKGEVSLSFYDSTLVTGNDLLSGAPGLDWGVARVSVGLLRGLGFMVVRDPYAGEPFGSAHVAATPSVYENGQIPAAIREGIALGAEWEVPPDRP